MAFLSLTCSDTPPSCGYSFQACGRLESVVQEDHARPDFQTSPRWRQVYGSTSERLPEKEPSPVTIRVAPVP